ncbi:MAG: hypothetical protein ABDH91_04620 [Bacteroidia bacterium]
MRFPCLLLGGILLGQNQGARFLDPVFSRIGVTKNIKYGHNLSFTLSPTDLYMDMYEPLGDTMARRPVIILIHAGSFLPPTIAGGAFGRSPIGTREDSGIVGLCIEFARRGYLAISATHRLGWNPNATTQDERAKSIIQAVWRATQDGRALVRFLRKDAATENRYRLDSTRIVMGGSSSGGYVGVHVAYLNRPEEFNLPKFLDQNGRPFIDTTSPDMGRGSGPEAGPDAFEGGSGNPGYSSRIQAVLSLGGAIGDTGFIQNERIPVIAIHGKQDPSTPWDSGMVYTAVGNYAIIDVYGSAGMGRYLYERGNQQALLPDFAGDRPYPGVLIFQSAGFEPFGWYANSSAADKARARTYLDSVVQFAAPRLFKVLNLPQITMPLASGVEVVSLAQAELEKGTISLYPSPASVPVVHLRASQPIATLELFQLTGEKVGEFRLPTPLPSCSWEISGLTAGVYLVRVGLVNGEHLAKLWSYQP